MLLIVLLYHRISFPKEVLYTVANHRCFSTCYSFSIDISCYMGYWGKKTERSRCLVGKADWINDVRMHVFSSSLIFNLMFLNVFWIHLYFVFYICICRIQSWKSPTVIYFLIVQLSAAAVALVDLYGSKFGLTSLRNSCWGHFLSAVERLGL